MHFFLPTNQRAWRRCLLAVLALVGLAAPAGRGQVAVNLVKDLRPGSGSSVPQHLTQYNGVLYFVATDGTTGLELFKTDGTAAGTTLVKDINPAPDETSLPRHLTVLNGLLLFAADGDNDDDFELWKSDGTEDGTVRVKDMAIYGAMTLFNGELYFRADEAVAGSGLWKTDGTADGTVLVKALDFYEDLNPTVFNGALYFQANDVNTGRELWKSDGTEAGTVLVEDIRPGSGGASPSDLTVFNGELYFRANDLVHGSELWKTNGTTTQLVRDLVVGADGSGPGNLTVVNGTLYFSANDGVNGGELWKTNGTAAGTVLVKDIRPGSDGSFPDDPVLINGTLYFRADDGANGQELWKSDGTAAGTVLVKDINPGSNGSLPNRLTNVNGTLYFQANDGTNGGELWKSDGTAAGTVLVKDINPGSSSSFPSNLAPINGTLYFQANDGTNGYELWKLAPAAEPCDPRVAGLPTTPSKLCRDQPLAVSFSLAGTCPDPAPNTFVVQLSNAVGSFANPTVLGSVTPGTTALPLPANLPLGTGYRVRVVSGGQISAASAPFQVAGPSLAVTPTVSGAPVCRGQVVTVGVNLPAGGCPFPEGNTFTVQLSSATGSFNNPTPLGTVPAGGGPVTIPAGVTAGSGYRIRLVSSNPALTSASSALFQVRNCNTRLSAEEAQLVVSPNPVSGGNAFPGEIRVRVSGMDEPGFSLTTSAGRGVGISAKTNGWGEWVLTPMQALAPGVYVLQAREGTTRLSQRVLVLE